MLNLASSCCIIFSSLLLVLQLAQATVVYRPAETSDLDRLLEIQSQFTTDDKLLLLLLPESHGMRKNGILKNIEMHRYTVAVDSEKDNLVVGYIKAFVVKDEAELADITCDELRCVKKGEAELVKQLSYSFSLDSKIGDLADIEEKKGIDLGYDFPFSPKSQGYIYYGSAYVVPSHRGAGIASGLLKSALVSLKDDLVTTLHNKGATELVVLFGQVWPNLEKASRNSMILDFSKFSKDVATELNASVGTPSRFGYGSFKPEITWAEGDEGPTVTFPTENRGRGSVLVYPFVSK